VVPPEPVEDPRLGDSLLIRFPHGFYRWRRKYGGMEVSEAKKLRELERENSELKRMVAEQALDIRLLKDLNSKKW
jgi:hypothetical protein